MRIGELETGVIVNRISDIAREGGAIAMRYHGRHGEVISKADSSPLTQADLAVDEFVVESLENAFPDIPVVTEERAASHSAGFAGDRFFLVDPIDGTREFVAERGEFTVNIALIESGTAIAGAVCAPAVDRHFAGAGGHGAWETDCVGEGRKTLVPVRPDNANLAVVASRSHLDERTRAFIKANSVARSVSAGSSLKFCLLAAGEADLYPRFGPTMEWDTAAGHAVLSAAGGFVEEISGDPLNYGKADYRNRAFIAYTPGTTFKLPAL